MSTQTLSPEQIAEVRRLKAYFPFRLCYGALSPTGEFEANAVATMARPRNLVRKGYHVEVLEVA